MHQYDLVPFPSNFHLVATMNHTNCKSECQYYLPLYTVGASSTMRSSHSSTQAETTLCEVKILECSAECGHWDMDSLMLIELILDLIKVYPVPLVDQGGDKLDICWSKWSTSTSFTMYMRIVCNTIHPEVWEMNRWATSGSRGSCRSLSLWNFAHKTGWECVLSGLAKCVDEAWGEALTQPHSNKYLFFWHFRIHMKSTVIRRMRNAQSWCYNAMNRIEVQL